MSLSPSQIFQSRCYPYFYPAPSTNSSKHPVLKSIQRCKLLHTQQRSAVFEKLQIETNNFRSPRSRYSAKCKLKELSPINQIGCISSQLIKKTQIQLSRLNPKQSTTPIIPKSRFHCRSLVIPAIETSKIDTPPQARIKRLQRRTCSQTETQKPG